MKNYEILHEQRLNTDKIISYKSFFKKLDKHLLEFWHSTISQKNNDYLLLYHILFPVIKHFPF